MKKFIYDVAGFEFEDTEAFGDAWKNAKDLATKKHVAIYRTVINGEKETREIYVKAGCFLPISLVMLKNVMIF